ncbi:MAG: 50S ribosomal protein L24e [Candidatus Woesearchaeota archaeon]
MVKCSFSGDDLAPGKGIMFVKKDGKILHFANSKCMKNFMMGRKARKVRWTADARKAKQERTHAKEHTVTKPKKGDAQ